MMPEEYDKTRDRMAMYERLRKRRVALVQFLEDLDKKTKAVKISVELVGDHVALRDCVNPTIHETCLYHIKTGIAAELSKIDEEMKSL